jgi:hypothetical protein
MHASRQSEAAITSYISSIQRDVDESVAAARGRILLISGEGIGGLKRPEVKRMARFFRQRFDNVTIVAYVRPPAAFISSAFQESIKTGNLREFDVTGSYRHYRASFAKFDAAFDRENVLLWKFDPDRFPANDVVRDFCTRLQIDLPAERIVRRNESLSREVVGLLYAYHKFRDLHGIRPVKGGTHRLIELLRKIGDGKFRLSPRIVQPVIEDNEADIEWIENRLGEKLHEPQDDGRPGDVSQEADLLQPDPVIVAKVRKALGRAAPKHVTGQTPEEVALLLHQLASQPRPRALGA